jgi:hypothetical protein
VIKLSKLFHSYSPEKQQEVRERLYKFQNGKCFLCDNPLDLNNPKSMHLDHKKAQAEKGPDDESNWVLLCSTCNLKKSDMPLQLAKNRLQFERDKKKYGESFTLGKVFDIMRNGAEGKPLFMRKLQGSMIELEFVDENGVQVKQQSRIYDDSIVPDLKYIVVELPVSHLFHDKDLNPRAISEKDVNLIDEFYYGNPQLHFCLGRIEEIEKLKGVGF